MSQRKRNEIAETQPLRDAYVAAVGRCANVKCGSTVTIACHEIPAGAHRHRAVYRPDTWLVLCRKCHDVIQGTSFTDQAAIKFAVVVSQINECVGREAVSLEDVCRRILG